MTALWLVGACLLAGALLFLLPPLLQRSAPRRGVAAGDVNLSVYRHQLEELRADVAAGTLSVEQFDSGRRELEQRMLRDVDAAGVRVQEPGGRLPELLVGALTIQSAIDVAEPNQRIVVYPGWYYENIYFMRKNIILQSSNPVDIGVVSRTVIYGQFPDSTVNFSGSENDTSVFLQNPSSRCVQGYSGIPLREQL